MSPDAADLEAIRAVVTGVVHHIDRARWPELRALFASTVETDYTSLFGGSPIKQPADDLIAGWRAALNRVVTQHLLGPIDVAIDGPSARAACHVRAFHFKEGASGGDTWEVLGHYRFELVRAGKSWTITAMTLETQHQLGNKALLA
jgi:SnoaL-like protein